MLASEGDATWLTRSQRILLWPLARSRKRLHLGYRRTKTGGGSWVARRFLGEGRYAEMGLGPAQDLHDADGAAVLSFKDAQEAARHWWKARERDEMGIAPESGPYTLADAISDYFEAR